MIIFLIIKGTKISIQSAHPTRIRRKLNVPQIGDEVVIIITWIQSVENFYVQFSTNRNEYENFSLRLNATKNVQQYRKYIIAPGISFFDLYEIRVEQI